MTNDMNSHLGMSFVQSKVDVALSQMSPGKASSPNRFSVAFFKEQLQVMGNDIVGIGLDALNNVVPLDLINVTNIALISKKNKPEYPSEFRLIIICNVLYKLIFKVIANRLKPIIDDIVWILHRVLLL